MNTIAMIRTRWAAAGAAVAVTLGAVGLGGLNNVSAGISTGDRPVYVPINPCRLIDTRPGDANVGAKSSPLGPDETLTVTAHGSNGECTGPSAIPTDAVGLSLNVTALGQTQRTFLTVWGEGADPGTSNLNPSPGQPPTPNAVNTPLSATGSFNVRNDAGNVNAIVDVVGYYADHDHDDRYYTEAEVDAEIDGAIDAAIAEAVDPLSTMWARVEPDGTIVDASPGVTGEEYAFATGRVVVRFPRDVSTCAYSISVTQDVLGQLSTIAVSGDDIGIPIGDDAVYVYMTRDGADFDIELSLTVNC